MKKNENLSSFATQIELWYDGHGRQLPWRQTDDPYCIWLSEIILQQTRIAQGLDYYRCFVARWPDAFSLARASEDDVLKQWEGLGYYSRARNLHKAAESISEAGAFPTDYAGVLALKGVGEYTASAICSIAFGLPRPAIDGNAYRVFSRVFGIDSPIDTNAGKKVFRKIAEEIIDRKRPGTFNQAVMDLGATLCTPRNPHCEDCPLNSQCVAWAEKRMESLPVKSKRVKVEERWLHYFWITWQGKLLLHRRERGIWKKLWEPLLVEAERDIPSSVADTHWDWLEQECRKGGLHMVLLKDHVRHQLTHRTLWASFFRIDLPSGCLPEQLPSGYAFYGPSEVESMAFPELVRKMLGQTGSPLL